MPKSIFDEVLKDVRAALTDEALTPEGRVRALLDQIEQSTIPPERAEAFRRELKGLAALIRDQRMKASAQSVLVREAGEFFRHLRDLARPIPRATPDDEIRRCYEQLEASGWNSTAINDLLRPELRDGERLTLIASDAVTIGLRRVTKADLIAKYRPHAMDDEHFATWAKAHGALPTTMTERPSQG
jgi:hypothetical protein